MVKDYGFELPDTRETFFTPDNGKVEIIIVRHWGYIEDDDGRPEFKVSFNINYTAENGAQEVTQLPIGTDESKASKIAHELYETDIEATSEWNEAEAITRAEMRMGA